jgi:hypothetical protein
MTRALGFESLLYDEQDGVATMTLNRPAGWCSSRRHSWRWATSRRTAW